MQILRNKKRMIIKEWKTNKILKIYIVDEEIYLKKYLYIIWIKAQFFIIMLMDYKILMIIIIDNFA